MFYLQQHTSTSNLVYNTSYPQTTHKSVSWCVQRRLWDVRLLTARTLSEHSNIQTHISIYTCIYIYICSEFMYTLTLHKHKLTNVQENTQTPVYPVWASDSVSNQPVLQHLCNGTLSVAGQHMHIFLYVCIYVWNAAIVVVGGVVLLIAELRDPQPFSPAHKTKRTDKRTLWR